MSAPRSTLARWLLAAAISTIACARSGAPTSFGSGPMVVAEATPKISALEREMHARLNRDRSKQGLGPLSFDAELADIARAHSKDMDERNFFSHDSPRTGSLEDRLDRAGVLMAVARENIGQGQSVDSTQDALLGSPGHRENIMSRDVTHVGIGIVQVGSGPSAHLMVTQVFAKPIARQDPDAARGAVARRIAAARRSAGVRALPAHPLLEKLAKKHVDDVTDDLDASASRRIGEAVTRELQGSGLSGVAVATTVFLSSDLYEPQGAVTAGNARAIGIATARARDARGRPAIKALFLVGQ